MTTPPKLKDMKRKELRKLAKKYGLEVDNDMGRKELRRLLKTKMKDGIEPQKSKEELVVDFINSLKAFDDEMEPIKEAKKELKRQYKGNGWLDAKEQKRALQAYRILKDGDNIDKLVKFYKELIEKVGE